MSSVPSMCTHLRHNILIGECLFQSKSRNLFNYVMINLLSYTLLW